MAISSRILRKLLTDDSSAVQAAERAAGNAADGNGAGRLPAGRWVPSFEIWKYEKLFLSNLVNSQKQFVRNRLLSWTRSLQVAGFRLYAAYGRQFVKLLHCVDDDFLADLRKVR